jgi:hypothetical protein
MMRNNNYIAIQERTRKPYQAHNDRAQKKGGYLFNMIDRLL